uniref:Uncharacterized protein n=1 Tax=Oryza punctata TaxID=4537 RepID=A0A0E0MKZ7_ORYPU
MNKLWHEWKNSLNTHYVKKGKAPFEKYGKIMLPQWDKFVKFKTSPKEMAKIKKMSDLAKRNNWHHCLGFIVEERGGSMRNVGVPVPMEDREEWSKNWLKTRTPKNTDKGEVVLQNPKLQQIADNIQCLASERTNGTLGTALGNLEHSRRVRRVSSKLSWKEGFKKDESSYKKHDAYKGILREEGRQLFRNEMMEFCISQGILPKPGESSNISDPGYPFDDILVDTPCRLHVPIGRAGKTIEATRGMDILSRTYYDSTSNDYAKVQPQILNEGFETTRYDEDPSPTKEEVYAPKDDDNGNDKSKVCIVQRSHNSKSENKQNKKWMWVQLLQSKRRGTTGNDEEVASAYILAGNVFSGYYTCEFLIVDGRYRINPKDLPRIVHRTSFDDEGIRNILCHFIDRECCHRDGMFLDPKVT